MTIHHYENFPVGSILLPQRLRAPIHDIYRFARAADDFADEGTLEGSKRLALLADFSEQLRRIERGAPCDTELFEKLQTTIKAHRLPIGLFHDLLSAFSQDVTKKRYANFAEVLHYCERSANPIGRLLLQLFDAVTPQTLQWSDNICSSLQIINFLQDIAIDFAMGRVYLPQDELARFGITEMQIANGDCGGRWREFMIFEVARAREMLRSGLPLGHVLKRRSGIEIRLIVAGGDRILSKISKADGDVFRSRPVLRFYDWPMLLMRALTC